MGLNLFDIESIRTNARRKAEQMHADCVRKFNQPAIETAIGEAWNTRVKPMAGEELKRMMPKQYKEMEAQYGASE